ncbi:MAG: hypothetical protein ACFFBW_12325 [Promethearchaeota archaeon]
MELKSIGGWIKRNKNKIWNIFRMIYWILIFFVALVSIILLYSEFL